MSLFVCTTRFCTMQKWWTLSKKPYNAELRFLYATSLAVKVITTWMKRFSMPQVFSNRKGIRYRSDRSRIFGAFQLDWHLWNHFSRKYLLLIHRTTTMLGCLKAPVQIHSTIWVLCGELLLFWGRCESFASFGECGGRHQLAGIDGWLTQCTPLGVCHWNNIKKLNYCGVLWFSCIQCSF